MSDYINAYIDNTVGMIHENVTTILQTRTHLRLANDTIAQKDSIISQLSSQIEQLNNQSASQIEQLNIQNLESERLKEEIRGLNQSNQDLTNQITTLGILSNQVNEINNVLNDKDINIASLQQQIAVLNETNHALTNKLSHFDTLSNQVSEMKSMILERDRKIFEIERDKDLHIENLKNEIELLKNPVIIKEPESTLNTKIRRMTKVLPVNSNTALSSTKAETDDF
jgi:chromosome segregation ATPase